MAREAILGFKLQEAAANNSLGVMSQAEEGNSTPEASPYENDITCLQAMPCAAYSIEVIVQVTLSSLGNYLYCCSAASFYSWNWGIVCCSGLL